MKRRIYEKNEENGLWIMRMLAPGYHLCIVAKKNKNRRDEECLQTDDSHVNKIKSTQSLR